MKRKNGGTNLSEIKLAPIHDIRIVLHILLKATVAPTKHLHRHLVKVIETGEVCRAAFQDDKLPITLSVSVVPNKTDKIEQKFYFCKVR